ncbi:MAG: hypothetical protein IPK07_34420 [Deltaproteobacteria bacterium]|nr:hypothetical protein [Deltaproteobacteria bacterium]
MPKSAWSRSLVIPMVVASILSTRSANATEIPGNTTLDASCNDFATFLRGDARTFLNAYIVAMETGRTGKTTPSESDGLDDPGGYAALDAGFIRLTGGTYVDLGRPHATGDTDNESVRQAEQAKRTVRRARDFWQGISILGPDGQAGTSPVFSKCSSHSEIGTPKLDAFNVDWTYVAQLKTALPTGFNNATQTRPFKQAISVPGRSQFLVRYVATSPKIIQEVAWLKDQDFFGDPRPLKSPTKDGEPVGTAFGHVDINGNPAPSNTTVECIDSRTSSPYPSDSNLTDGDYVCDGNLPILAGQVSLRANGTTKACPCPLRRHQQCSLQREHLRLRIADRDHDRHLHGAQLHRADLAQGRPVAATPRRAAAEAP